VVLQSDEQTTAEDLRIHVKSELSAYKVPRKFFFHAHEELPFTDSGKIDKRALLELIDA
jgi:acyl-CoA synthetase (AMP-forming)/AMP-acid ligase II